MPVLSEASIEKLPSLYTLFTKFVQQSSCIYLQSYIDFMLL